MASPDRYPPASAVAGELLRQTRAVTVETVYTVSCEICGFGAVDGIYYDEFGAASDARESHMIEHTVNRQVTDI